MQSIILVLLSVFCLNAFGLECFGILTNETTKETKRVTLNQASYDKDFLEADVNNYGLGVDKWSLKNTGDLTLVITEKKTKSATASTAGFKKIVRNDGGTTLTNDLRFFFTLPDGSSEEIQINCYEYL